MEEPIEVNVVDGKPVAFKWRDHIYQIFEILHRWESEERGWLGLTSREHHHHYRVQAGWSRHRVTAEITFSAARGEEQWILSHVYD